MPNYFRLLDNISVEPVNGITPRGQASQMMVRGTPGGVHHPFCIKSPFTCYSSADYSDGFRENLSVGIGSPDSLVYVITDITQWSGSPECVIGLWYESTKAATVRVYSRVYISGSPPQDTLVDEITIQKDTTGTWWIPDWLWDQEANSDNGKWFEAFTGEYAGILWAEVVEDSEAPVTLYWLRPPFGYLARQSSGSILYTNPVAFEAGSRPVRGLQDVRQCPGAGMQSAPPVFAHPRPTKNNRPVMGVLKNAVSWQQPFPSVYPLTRSLTFYGSDYYYPGSIWSGSPGSYYHSDSGVLYEDALWGAYSSSLVSSNPPKATTEGDGVIEIRKHPQGCVTRTATLLAGGAVSESTSGRTPLLFVGAGLFLRYFLSGFNNPSSEGGGSVYLDVRAEDENGSSASVFSFTLSVPEFSYETGGSAQHQDIIDLSLPPNGTRRIYARLTSSCSECDFNGSIFSKPVDLVEPVVNMYDESICAGGVEISTDAHTPSRGHASFYNATGLPNKWHRVPNFFGLSASHGVSESLSNEAAFRHYLPQNGVLTVSSVDEIPVESTFSVAAVSSPYSWVEMPGPGSQTAYIRAWKYTATATGSHKVEVAFSNPLYYSETTQSVEVRAWVDDDTLSSDPAARITVQTPIAVVSGFVTSPPSDPGANGTQYAILNDATGIFDGKTGTIATWHGSSSDNPWTFENVADGTVARQYVAVYIWDGKSWNEATTFPIVSLRVTLETGQSVSVIAHRGGNGPSCIDTLAAAYRLRVIPPT